MVTFARMLLAAFVLLAVSCTHKDLCYDHSHIVDVKVLFDWSQAPDAYPESMSLYLFDEDGTNPQRYELRGYQGGNIRLTPGVYHAICLNSGTRNIDCRDKEHLSSFLITTKDEDLSSITSSLGLKTSTLPRARGTEDERMVREPERLWTGRLHSFSIAEGAGNSITLVPEEAVVPISITIRNVRNLRYVSAMRGTITGLSEGILAGDGTHNGTCVTMPFTLTKGEEENTLRARMYAFGDCLSGSEAHFVNLYLVLTDGTKWNYSYDVTSQMHAEREDMELHIVLDELPVPQPEGPGNTGGGGGFVPTIDGWNSVNIGIKM